MIGTSMPSSRACVTSGMAASMRPDTTSASGCAAFASVSSARKSVSALEKVRVSTVSRPSSSSADSKALNPDSVNASSLLYSTTTFCRPSDSLAFAIVCGITAVSGSELRKT